MASTIGLAMLQAGANMWGQDRQNRAQMNLDNNQYQNQRLLNEQGRDIQMDIWNRTNYGAQVAHMKKAGLNPALMYAKGGQGGTTGSQTGGGAKGGQAVAMAPMDVANLSLVKAQRAKIENEGNLAKAREKDILDKLPKEMKGLEEGINESIVRQELGSANVELTRGQLRKVTEEANKIVADTRLVNKMIKMDYTEVSGRNWMANLERAVGGEYDVSDYFGLLALVSGLGVLRNPKYVMKIGKKGVEKAKVLTGALNKKIRDLQLGRKVRQEGLDKGKGTLQWSESFKDALKGN